MAKRKPESRPTTTEKQFENTLRSVAQAAGWTHQFHIVDRGHNAQVYQVIRNLQHIGMHEAAQMVQRSGHSKVTSSGFPDWVFRHPQRGILIVELKSDRTGANPTSEQIDWLIAFAKDLKPPDNPYAPSRAHLWRPSMWPAIETQLGLHTTPTYCNCNICEIMKQNPDTTNHTTL